MKTANYKSYFKRLFLAVLFLHSTSILFAQDPTTVRDSTSTTFSFGKLDTPDPASIESKYTYDPLTDRYFYTSTVGDFNINYPRHINAQRISRPSGQRKFKSLLQRKIRCT